MAQKKKSSTTKKARKQTVVLAVQEAPVPLSPTENDELKDCERVIKRGWGTFVEVGRALSTIRDKQLYRADHKTFEAYCRQRWQYGRSYAYRLIGAAEVVDDLSPIGDKRFLPINEAQIRPLIPLSESDRQEAWKQTLERREKKKPITARLVKSVVAEILPPKPSAPKRKKSRSKLLIEKASRLVDDGIEAETKGDSEKVLKILETLKSTLADL